MSFQENKFPILLGVTTAVVTGGLVFWGMKSGSKYEEAKSSYDEALSKINSLSRADLAPTTENARAKKQAVEEYGASVAELQKAFDPLRKPKLENTDPSAFTDALLESRKGLVAKFEEAGTAIPDGFFLGLGRFSEAAPPQRDTGVLMFELRAFEELLTKLAEAAPARLDNLHWAGIPDRPEDAALVAHPIEVTFTGSESSLRDFLSSLDDSEEYYYVVRSMRVKNERETAPNAKDARFEAPKEETPAADAGNDPFGGAGFVFPPDEEEGDGDAEGEEETEEPAPEPEPEPEFEAGDSGEVLKQVLGTEKVHVFLRVDVIQFLEARELPGSKRN